MELKDTVKLMLSDDWRDRLKAEWLQAMNGNNLAITKHKRYRAAA